MRHPVPRLMTAALLVLAFALPAACGGDPVRLGTPGDYPPFNELTGSGDVVGLERDLADELCRRAGLECVWVIHEWDTLIDALRGEQFDAIIAGMSISASREELIDFTQPYYPPTPAVYLVRADSADDAINGLVGVFANSVQEGYLRGAGAQIMTYTESDDSIAALAAGDVDAVLVDHGYAVAVEHEYGGQLRIAGPTVAVDFGIGMGVRQGSPLRAQFDDALSAMKADGSLNALITKWFGGEAALFP